MLTNRPDYAPDRRPGDPTDLERSAYDTVTLHTTHRDALVLADLIDAGAAALAHMPGGSAVGIITARRHAEMGHAAAQALRDEVERQHARDEHRYREQAKRARKAEREREKEGEQLERLERGTDLERQLKAAGTMDAGELRDALLEHDGNVTPPAEPAAEVDVEPINTWRTQHHVGAQALTNKPDIEHALEQRMRSQLAERGAEVLGQITFTWDQREDGTYDITGVAAFDHLELHLDPDAQVATAGGGVIERTRRR